MTGWYDRILKPVRQAFGAEAERARPPPVRERYRVERTRPLSPETPPRQPPPVAEHHRREVVYARDSDPAPGQRRSSAPAAAEEVTQRWKRYSTPPPERAFEEQPPGYYLLGNESEGVTFLGLDSAGGCRVAVFRVEDEEHPDGYFFSRMTHADLLRKIPLANALRWNPDEMRKALKVFDEQLDREAAALDL